MRAVLSCSAVILKLSSIVVEIIFASAPVRTAMSSYETQYGAGITTSSPASKTDKHKLKIHCLPPTPTTISSAL